MTQTNRIQSGRVSLLLAGGILATFIIHTSTVSGFGELGVRRTAQGAVLVGHLLIVNMLLAGKAIQAGERPRWPAIVAISLGTLPAMQAACADGRALGAMLARSTRASEATPVLVAGRKLPAGHLLVASDLGIREMQTTGGQSRFIPCNRAPSLIGRKILFPLKKGDPLWWTHVDWDSLDPVAPRDTPPHREDSIP